MKLVTVKEFIKMLSEQVAAGDKLLYIRFENQDEEIIAADDIYPDQISISHKSAEQTSEGDKPVLRITFKIDTE
jgi:hypothetical protein